jgi:hypothetical protein
LHEEPQNCFRNKFFESLLQANVSHQTDFENEVDFEQLHGAINSNPTVAMDLDESSSQRKVGTEVDALLLEAKNQFLSKQFVSVDSRLDRLISICTSNSGGLKTM